MNKKEETIRVRLIVILTIIASIFAFALGVNIRLYQRDIERSKVNVVTMYTAQYTTESTKED
jgi:hypothetical protein